MYRYILPNGIKIGEEVVEMLVSAAISDRAWPEVYLDTMTGLVISVPSKEILKRWVEEVGDTKRYFGVLPFSSEDRHKAAEEFIDNVLEDWGNGIYDDEKLEGALRELGESIESAAVVGRRALDSSGMRGFERYLINSNSDLLLLWEDWLYDAARSYVHQWLTCNPFIKITAEEMTSQTQSSRKLTPEVARFLATVSTESLMEQVAKQMDEIRRSDT